MRYRELLAIVCLTAGAIPGVGSSSRAQYLSDTSRSILAVSDKDEFSTVTAKESPTTEAARPRKSMWKAALLSAAMPGAGEYYLGHKSKARVFFAAEAVSWAGFAAYKVYSHWKKDDLIRFANERASANLDGKSDDFFDLVGYYTSVRDYNTFGRVFDPQRPYLDENSSDYWQWQSDHDRQVYRSLKNAGREANRRSKFMIGAAIINRIVSVIDAVRDARRQDRKIEDSFSSTEQPRMRFSFDPMSSRHQVNMTLLTNW
jgi:hypothetical protein